MDARRILAQWKCRCDRVECFAAPWGGESGGRLQGDEDILGDAEGYAGVLEVMHTAAFIGFDEQDIEARGFPTVLVCFSQRGGIDVAWVIGGEVGAELIDLLSDQLLEHRSSGFERRGDRVAFDAATVLVGEVGVNGIVEGVKCMPGDVGVSVVGRVYVVLDDVALGAGFGDGGMGVRLDEGGAIGLEGADAFEHFELRVVWGSAEGGFALGMAFTAEEVDGFTDEVILGDAAVGGVAGATFEGELSGFDGGNFGQVIGDGVAVVFRVAGEAVVAGVAAGFQSFESVSVAGGGPFVVGGMVGIGMAASADDRGDSADGD
ncbi:MAG: hypothetical protein RI897_2509 [Verrucomicrobiota bacterium]